MRNTNEDHQDHINRDDVDDEHITSPRRNHVEITQRTAGRDEQRACIDTLHPQIEGEDHSKDGNSFVIIRAAHRSRNIGRNDTNKRSS